MRATKDHKQHNNSPTTTMAGEYGYWREKRLYNSKLGPASSSDSSIDDNSSKKSKRQVKVSTFDKWKRDITTRLTGFAMKWTKKPAYWSLHSIARYAESMRIKY